VLVSQANQKVLPAALDRPRLASSHHHRFIDISQRAHCDSTTAIMSQFRAAKLDIGCFAKIRNIRDHTKRKVYMENEPERYASNFFTQVIADHSPPPIDKLSDTSSETPRSRSESVHRPSSSYRKCTATPGSHRSRTGV
jgi:hypothetical protein